MGTGPQPCTADHRVTHVIAPVAQLCLAGVDRHPHLDAGHLLGQRPLHIHRRRDRIGRPRERGHHAVALALLDGTHPTMSGDTLVDHGVVAGDDRPGRVRRPLPQPRRPLDVGQQERDRACRHHERRRLCHLHLHDQRFSRHRKVSHPHTMRQTSAPQHPSMDGDAITANHRRNLSSECPRTPARRRRSAHHHERRWPNESTTES